MAMAQRPEPPPAAIAAAPPRFSTDALPLQRALATAAAALPPGRRAGGAATAEIPPALCDLLTALWLGRDDDARNLLEPVPHAASPRSPVTDPDAPRDPRAPRDEALAADCHQILQHYWYLRATSDEAPSTRAWSSIAAAADRVAASRPDDDVATAALQLHALACAGGILDSQDRLRRPSVWSHGAPPSPPGAVWAARAAARRQQFEQRHWSEADGAFRAWQGTVAPQPAAAFDATAALMPCWLGMLATTGDRTLRNADAALAALRSRRDREPALAARWLTAVTQLDGDRDAAFAAVLRAAAADPAALDALCFALTGVRLATGPGIDEDWIRLRPYLPPGATFVRVANLRHDGWSLDLATERRRGLPTDDEQVALQRCQAGAEPTPLQPPDASQAGVAAARERVFVTVTLRSPDPPPGYRRVVVHLGGRLFVSALRRGETLTLALPAPAGAVSAAAIDR